MIETVKRISNPLTIVGIFAALAEIASTAALVALDKETQILFIWFVMGFPVLLVTLFFYVLVKHPRALYAPSDYRSDDSFLKGFEKNTALLLQKTSSPSEHPSGNAHLSLEKLGELANVIGEEGRRSFTTSDRDALMSLLKALHTSPDVTNTTEFAAYLEKVIDAFAGAGLDKNIDRLDSLYRDVIQDRGGIIQTMIQHYGMRVLGSDSPSDDTKKRFFDYVSLAKESELAEMALPFLLAFSHASGNVEAVSAALSEAQVLDSDERETLGEMLDKFSDASSMAIRTTPKVASVAKKFENFKSHYSAQLNAILQT